MKSGPDESSRALGILEKLKQNCNMQATAHAYLRDDFGIWSLRLTIGAIFLTAALLPFSLVSDSFVQNALHLTADGFRVVNALVAFTAFGFVLVQLAWQPDSRAKEHDHAVKHYVRAKLAIQRLQQKGDVTLADVEAVQEKYLDDAAVPPIPEKQFIFLKTWHHNKVSASRAIDLKRDDEKVEHSPSLT